MNGYYTQNYAGNQRDGDSQNTELTHVNSNINRFACFPSHCKKMCI